MSEKKVTWARFKDTRKWTGKKEVIQYEPGDKRTVIQDADAIEEACKFASSQGEELINITERNEEMGYEFTVYYWKYTGSY